MDNTIIPCVPFCRASDVVNVAGHEWQFGVKSDTKLYEEGQVRAAIQTQYQLKEKWRKLALQLMDDVLIDTCDQGHKFAKLPDHLIKDGRARCPHCMAVDFDNLYKDWLIKDQLLDIILPIVDRAGDYCEEDTAENICDDLKREVSKFIDKIISGNVK